MRKPLPIPIGPGPRRNDRVEGPQQQRLFCSTEAGRPHWSRDEALKRHSKETRFRRIKTSGKLNVLSLVLFLKSAYRSRGNARCRRSLGGVTGLGAISAEADPCFPS